jgi:cytochrome c5
VAQNLAPLAQAAPQGADAAAPAAMNYLATNLGPGINLPPQQPVALPDGPGKRLVETRCALCHDLERVAAVKRKKQDWTPIVANMVAWGAPATADEAKTITDYLAANFGD